MSTNLVFVPVNVSRGRKFRGFGYVIGSSETGGYGWSQVNAKIWNPETKQIVYANADFCEDDTSVDNFILEQAKAEYIKHTIQSTIDWCRAQKPNMPEAEILLFARNVLKKHHSEMIEEIDRLLPDTRDIHEEIEKILKWASGLTTRACYMYGRFCPGGKPLPIQKVLAIALSACEKRGFTKNPEFQTIWNKLTEQ